MLAAPGVRGDKQLCLTARPGAISPKLTVAEFFARCAVTIVFKASEIRAANIALRSAVQAESLPTDLVHLTPLDPAMLPRNLNQATRADIDRFVANSVSESRTLDFKQELPSDRDKDAKDFIADASAFANTIGGDIVYGVRDEEGVAVEVVGLKGIDFDKEVLRLNSRLRDGTEPRIFGVEFHQVDDCLVLRVRQSWQAPHAVTHGGTFRFYKRDSRGKHQMDVAELRDAFLAAETIPARIRALRRERIEAIRREPPVPLVEGPKLVLHVVPVSSLTGGRRISPQELKAHAHRLAPLCGVSGMSRFNADGLFAPCRPSEGPYEDYAQSYTSGMIETATARISVQSDWKALASTYIEKETIESVSSYFETFRELDVPPPCFLLFSLIDAKGYTLATGPRPRVAWNIDRDIIEIPELLVEDFDDDVAKLLRPVFDTIWNAAGIDGSENYNVEGNWSYPR